MEHEMPKRRKLRLDNYDYSTTGAYYVTICTQNRKRVLSEIVKSTRAGIDESTFPDAVGDGALDVPKVKLTPIGKIVEKYLLSSESISGVNIDQYVIMPDHIHLIIFLDSKKYDERKSGTSKAPSPTNEMLPHVVSTFKRFCNREIGAQIFQRSYIEHVIRDKADYETKRKYIYENPIRWYYENDN
ncbi:MAG: hypothetical protein J6D87_07800 [Clostridia bacterium]|nr:hypothetical protein [Clostridia bacterium]